MRKQRLIRPESLKYALKRARSKRACVRPPLQGETSVVYGEFDYRVVAADLDDALVLLGLGIYPIEMAE